MITSIGKVGAPVREYRRWFYTLILVITSCTAGDRLTELAILFASIKDDVNNAKSLIVDLYATEGISTFESGIKYNETPDRVRYGIQTPFISVVNLELKEQSSAKKILQLGELAKRISARSIFIDEGGLVWVVMYYGRNYHYGYVFAGDKDRRSMPDETLPIPHEDKWIVFRR